MSYKDEFQAENALPAESMSFGTDRFAFRAVLVTAALILTAVTIWPIQASALNQEGGPFETISAAALLAAGLAALYRFPGATRLYIGLVCLLLAERELEADIYAVGSIPFWVLNGLDTLLDMTIVRVVLAVVVVGGVVWHGMPNAWRALKQRAPFLFVFVLAGMFAVIAQLLEEVSGMFSADLSQVMMVRLFVLEETLEMFFSIGILAAVLIGWPKSRTEENYHDEIAKPDPR
ncbi:hypothetical protein [Ruegeria lacuscaerulensis]|uniref:hypothetical protein n=1 Tax=Ruegeria lacuscaerulensis TaxID=55218 RepID=UPI00147E7866|nr:hypothetical protein [Ruegeria lacuscaerulensis]